MRKKLSFTITFLIFVVFLLGFTYAYYEWAGNVNTDIGFDADGIKITYDDGANITGSLLIPTSTKEQGVKKEIIVDLDSLNGEPPLISLNLFIKDIDVELIDPSFKWTIAYKEEVVAEGNFNNVSENDTISLTVDQPLTLLHNVLDLYIWIDNNMDNPYEMLEKDFSFELSATGRKALLQHEVLYNISGFVYTTDGQPLRNTLIEIHSDPITTLTDDRGFYTVKNVPPGNHTLQIVDTQAAIELVHDAFTIRERIFNFNNEEIILNNTNNITLDILVDTQEKEIKDVINSTVNEPVLNSNLIPVIYKDNQWVKADSLNVNESWHDYDNGMWANAVIVSDYSKYGDVAIDTPILEADILAYYVWIPRFMYKLFNPSMNSMDPELIDVVFSNGTEDAGTVQCSIDNKGVETCTNERVGEYYTHPAFTFGGKELTGFWMGKFEVTGSETAPTIKPNLASLRNKKISAMVTSVNRLSANLNNEFDSHLIKNIEWGAVSYLAYSKYGVCDTLGNCNEIAINNSSKYYTGRSSGSATSSSTSSNGTYTYEVENGMKASTTGNITGVYDMSGGAFEYAMANMRSSAKSTAFNKSSSGLSSFGEQYYDVYQYSLTKSGSSTYQRSHLGDAMGETRAWYGDNTAMLYGRYPWIKRSGGQTSAKKAGVCFFQEANGSNNSSTGYRSVLTDK